MIGLVRFVTGIVALFAGMISRRRQSSIRAAEATPERAAPTGSVPESNPPSDYESCRTCRFWAPDSDGRRGHCGPQNTHMSSRYPCRHWRRKKA